VDAGVGFVCALGGGFGGVLAGWGGGVACGFGEEQAVTVAKTISAEHRIAHQTLKCAAIRLMRTSQLNSKEWPTGHTCPSRDVSGLVHHGFARH
jgi:hypothetical protein